MWHDEPSRATGIIMEDVQIYYKRNPPHFPPPGATVFITFRLAGSLPAEVIARLKEEHRQDEKLLLLIKDENTRQKENSDLHIAVFCQF